MLNNVYSLFKFEYNIFEEELFITFVKISLTDLLKKKKLKRLLWEKIEDILRNPSISLVFNTNEKIE